MGTTAPTAGLLRWVAIGGLTCFGLASIFSVGAFVLLGTLVLAIAALVAPPWRPRWERACLGALAVGFCVVLLPIAVAALLR